MLFRSEYKGREIKKVSIVHVKVFGRHFAAPKKFVEMIEAMLPCFYGEIVQHLKNWTKSAPKISEKKPDSCEPVIADPGQKISAEPQGSPQKKGFSFGLSSWR